MARKRRRKHRKNPRTHRRSAHRRKRRHASNPRRRHHRRNPTHRRKRRRARNPKHRVRGHMARGRGGRRHHVRSHMSNPRRGRRRRRRNPGIPTWAKVALAAVAGVAVYAIVSDGAFALTQRTDPTMGTLVRNRYILGGLAAAGGVALALTASPIYGVAVAVAAVVASGLGTSASLALGKVLDKPLPGATTTTTKGLGAVYGQNLQAVYGQNMQGLGAYQQIGAYTRQLGAYQQIGAVYGQNMQGIGDFAPPAPWASPTPF